MAWPTTQPPSKHDHSQKLYLASYGPSQPGPGADPSLQWLLILETEARLNLLARDICAGFLFGEDTGAGKPVWFSY